MAWPRGARSPPTNTVGAALSYFALVFGAGFPLAHLASRNPVSGSVHLARLGVMAAMPPWLGPRFS